MNTWPHAPSKLVTEPGIYLITAGTYGRQHLFHGEERLRMVHDRLLDLLLEMGWDPMAWAVFSNHYHVLGTSPPGDGAVRVLTSKLHTLSARDLNVLDGTPGRKVWYRSWDTRITFEKSVLARMAYVHSNPVKHGLVEKPEDYPFCSARWFLARGDRPFVATVLSFKTDGVNVYDDF